MRARPKKIITKEQINLIEDIELNKIAYKYFILHLCQLDIAFELNYCERTINRRIREIYSMF